MQKVNSFIDFRSTFINIFEALTLKFIRLEKVDTSVWSLEEAPRSRIHTDVLFAHYEMYFMYFDLLIKQHFFRTIVIRWICFYFYYKLANSISDACSSFHYSSIPSYDDSNMMMIQAFCNESRNKLKSTIPKLCTNLP